MKKKTLTIAIALVLVVALAAGADTTAMFQNVIVPAGLDNANASSFSSVKVVAQAIQADGFATWDDAFKAFDAAQK